MDGPLIEGQLKIPVPSWAHDYALTTLPAGSRVVDLEIQFREFSVGSAVRVTDMLTITFEDQGVIKKTTIRLRNHQGRRGAGRDLYNGRYKRNSLAKGLDSEVRQDNGSNPTRHIPHSLGDRLSEL